MCLSPILIRHPRLRSYAYLQAKCISGSEIFVNPDLEYFEVPCGSCPECKRSRAAQWRIRLQNEFDYSTNCIFCTLTFSDEFLPKTKKDIQQLLRKFFFRYRWTFRDGTGTHARIPKHWFIVERGKFGRLHLHGFIFDSAFYTEDTPEDLSTPIFRKGNPRPHRINRASSRLLARVWRYGFCEVSTRISPKAISYSTKYSLKQDTYGDSIAGAVFCSPGIGKAYFLDHRSDIVRSVLNIHTPMVQAGTRVVPAPRYYFRLALQEISQTIGYEVDKYISELFLIKSINSQNVYPKTFRGVVYENERDFLEARKRDYGDFKRSSLYPAWKAEYDRKRSRISRCHTALLDASPRIRSYLQYIDIVTSDASIIDIKELYNQNKKLYGTASRRGT